MLKNNLIIENEENLPQEIPIKLQNLTVKEMIKRGSSCYCTECNNIILTGEKYIKAKYNNSYAYRPFWTFHLKCWEKFCLDAYK